LKVSQRSNGSDGGIAGATQPAPGPGDRAPCVAKPYKYYFITQQGAVEALSSWRKIGKYKDVIASVTWAEE
jgi:hypothetical protein